MKIVTCEIRAPSSPNRFLGALVSEEVLVDFGAAQSALVASGKASQALPGDMIGLLAAGDEALAAAQAALEYARSSST